MWSGASVSVLVRAHILAQGIHRRIGQVADFDIGQLADVTTQPVIASCVFVSRRQRPGSLGQEGLPEG